MEDFNKLEDVDLEKISGGMTIDFTENHYCPYHLCQHMGIQKMQESYVCKGAAYPTYYCPGAKKYFFEARNGFFDSYGNILVKKV